MDENTTWDIRAFVYIHFADTLKHQAWAKPPLLPLAKEYRK